MFTATSVMVENSDVLVADCDLLVLKYAQRSYGADRAVADALGLSSEDFAAMSPGRHRLIPTRGKQPYRNVLFVGVRSLADFDYTEIRRFSKNALAILAREDCVARRGRWP
jgi:hypothetical protein